MTLQDYIKLCQSKDFKELAYFLTSDIKDVSLKIAVTAIFDVYHPKDKPHGRGLDVWTKKLSGQQVSPIQNLFSGLVDLIDFVKAYQLADSTLEDKLLADAIKAYVYKHKVELSPMLLSGVLDATSIDVIKTLFPDLVVTKQQREEQLKLQFTEETTREITFFRLKNVIKDSLAEILGIKLYQFNFSMHKNEGALTFKDEFSSEYVKKIVDLLNLMEVSSNYYCFPNSFGMHRGIQIFASIQSLNQSLNEVRAKLNTQPLDQEESGSFIEISTMLKELEQLKQQPSEFKSQYGVH